MADTSTHHETPDTRSSEELAAHEAWFRKQVELGLKEAVETPDACIPLEDVLKQLDL